MTSFRGKRVVVMGLGLHGGGVAAVKWFARRGSLVVATDLRSRKTLAPSVKALAGVRHVRYVLGKHRKSDFARADFVAQNPLVPNDSPYLRTARKHGVVIVNDTSMFFEHAKGEFLGVTGTKGKTTVATLTAHVLRAQYGKRVLLAGNIPQFSLWDALDATKANSLSVLELSSWQLEGLPRVKRSPSVAVVTNLLDDHLNRYPSRAAYFEAKSSIWRYQDANGTVILNRDDTVCRTWGKQAKGRVLWYSLRPFKKADGAFLRSGILCVRERGKVIRVLPQTRLRLRGAHNVANVLAAILAARTHNVSFSVLRKAVQNFSGVSGRLEVVRVKNGVQFVNDTTATAPVAAVSALRSFSDKPIMIAGGTDKDLPYRELAHEMSKRAKRIILLPGTATEKLKKLLRKRFIEVVSMHDAVQVAVTFAKKGDVVLLSPGAASFGLFLHEFDRGDAFIKEVRSL